MYVSIVVSNQRLISELLVQERNQRQRKGEHNSKFNIKIANEMTIIKIKE